MTHSQEFLAVKTSRVFQPLNVRGVLLAAALVSAGIACSDKKRPTSPTQSEPTGTALKVLFTRIDPNQEVEVRVLLLDGRGAGEIHGEDDPKLPLLKI